MAKGVPGRKGLTARQRSFVLAYVSNGHNGTAAARDAGYRGNPRVLAAQASRLLTVVNVKAAVDELIGKAIEKAERGAIADLQECLEFGTMVMRSRNGDYLTNEGLPDIAKIKAAPAGLIKGVEISTTTNEEGQVFTRGSVRTESALTAKQQLQEYYIGGKAQQPTPVVNILAILGELPTGTLRELKAAFERRALPEKTA